MNEDSSSVIISEESKSIAQPLKSQQIIYDYLKENSQKVQTTDEPNQTQIEVKNEVVPEEQEVIEPPSDVQQKNQKNEPFKKEEKQ